MIKFSGAPAGGLATTAAGLLIKTADQGATGGVDTLPRSDFYYIGISSYLNQDYNPTILNSGPGGTTGDYRLKFR